MRTFGVLGAFDQNGCGHVAKDEMAIAVAPFQMARADLRVHDEGGADGSRAHHIGGCLDAERGRRTGDIHIKGKTTCAQKLLNFNGNGGVGTFHIRSGTNHRVHL